MEQIVVLTGAGMSADSGLNTFRDSGGLWEGHDIHEVATPQGWRTNPQKVLNFYNERRKQAFEAEPNAGHHALAELEQQYSVTIITQNVDSLHEQAGSSKVIHLHGQLSKVRSVTDASLIYEMGGDPILLGDTADDGGQLRPHVVWFGEPVPNIEIAAEVVPQADKLIVIGTSLMVYPAAGLTNYARKGIPKYLIDPERPTLEDYDRWDHLQQTAAKGTPQLVKQLMN